MASQRQRGGEGSLNVQGQEIEINVGVSVSEAMEIARQVVRANMMEYAGIAQEVVDQRLEVFTSEFIRRTQDHAPDTLGALRDPDVQYGLFTAQKVFARTGAEKLGEMLIDILIARCKEPTQSFLAIVLNEAIETVGLLTPAQINALTVNWICGETLYPYLKSTEDLAEWVRISVGPFTSDLPRHNAAYDHLVYAGCATLKALAESLITVWKRKYSGLFSKGFSADMIPHQFGEYASLFEPCTRGEDLLQVRGLNESYMEELAKQKGAPEEFFYLLRNLHVSQLLSDDEVEAIIIDEIDELRDLQEIWNSSRLRLLVPTSVGVAIAHSHWCRTTGSPSPLSAWIAE